MSRMYDDQRIENELNEIEKKRSAKMIDRVGGKEVIAKVHKIFYNKIFAHPWLSLFFNNIEQDHLENQQTDFMAMLFGGERVYGGRMPADAHEHIFVTEDMSTKG